MTQERIESHVDLRTALALLSLLVAVGCDRSQPSPLVEMPVPTEARARVASQRSVPESERWDVRDTITRAPALDSLVALAQAPGPWHPTNKRPPLGALAVTLRRDDVVIGVLRIGDRWLLASTDYSMDRAPRMRTLSRQEFAAVQRWLGIQVPRD
jgi:hypothetical protein